MSVLLAACLIVALHDGDTATVRCQERTKDMVIRVAEVDCPEARAFCWGPQPGNREARTAALEVCPIGSPAKVRLNKFDGRTRRWIAHIECNGLDLSSMLVSEGVCWAYIPSKGSDIPSLQKAAQDQRAGLWAGQPVAPNMWRKGCLH